MNIAEKVIAGVSLAVSVAVVAGGLTIIKSGRSIPHGRQALPNVVVAPFEDFVNVRGNRCLVWEMPENIHYYQCDDGEQGIYQVVAPEVPWRMLIPGQSERLRDRILAAR